MVTLNDPWFEELRLTGGLTAGETYVVNGYLVYTPDGEHLEWFGYFDQETGEVTP